MTRPAPPTDKRFLSREECLTFARRVSTFARGGGYSGLAIESQWMGNLRWARNRITTSGDVRNHDIYARRDIFGAKVDQPPYPVIRTNQITDTALAEAVRRAEYVLTFQSENPESAMYRPFNDTYLEPDIWSDATYNLQDAERTGIMRALVQPAIDAGMLAAGYIQVSAQGRAVMGNDGQTMYYPYTQAQYSVTVRDPKGSGSGWAGVDWHDWNRIDAPKLSAIALEKCLASRNPVAIEPGRYLTILEPQAVSDFMEGQWIHGRESTERNKRPFTKTVGGISEIGFSRIGERVIDERLTVVADPMDPMLGYVPFDLQGNGYRRAVWVENGVLRDLAYDRRYAMRMLKKETPLLSNGGFRMSGGTTSVDEMISTTKRGLLVTRFSNVKVINVESWVMTGLTRDGLWLIENGKIRKPVRNFRFTDSPLFAFNQIEQLGVPQRVFNPSAPVVVPAMKVRDFHFTSLVDAV